MFEQSMKGRLLVATPMLHDPNFHRTVVLVLEHGEDGALGVVLNRPSETEVIEAVPDWAPVAGAPSLVFVGGPVSPERALALARVHDGREVDGWAPLVDGVGTVDLGRAPDDLGVPIDVVRIFVGYTGWGPGQLDEELEAEGWLVCDAAPDDAFSSDPEHLWSTVLRRQPGTIAWLANFPPHPSLN